jgi:hypothetical protein
MSNDVTEAPAPASSLPPIRFSLLFLLLVITLVCLALGYAFRTRYSHATALFRVSPQKWSMWDGDASQFDAKQFEILQNTHVALIKSYFVLQSAVRNPAVAGLPILAGKADPVEWLQEKIEVEFPRNTEILEIRLRDRTIFASDLKSVVDAVAMAYENEVVAAERNRGLIQRDSLARALSQLEDELSNKMHDLQGLKKELGDTSAESIDVTIRQRDIDSLFKIVEELDRRLEIEDVNAGAPRESAQVQKLQPAMLTNE